MHYQTKKEMIYEILKKEIYDSEYELGEKLVISHLAKRFNSSETPVREALNQLNTEGLVEFLPHIGSIVSNLSIDDIREIFELRTELESFATRLAAPNLDEKDLQVIKKIINDSKEAFQQQDYETFEKLNIDFHMEIYNKCNNKLLIKTIEDLWSDSNRYPSVFKSNDEHIQQSISEHDEIYKALLKKDGLLAESKILKHKERAGKEILKLTQPKKRTETIET